MSYECAKSVRGNFVAVPSAEQRDGSRIFDTQGEAEKRCRELNRERAATLRSVTSQELMDMGFGWTEDEDALS